MKKLLNTQERVKNILTEYPKTRNNDMLLYLNVARMIDREFHQDVLNKPFGDVITKMDKYNLPSFGSVGRSRRKLQEKYPELRATEEVKKFRTDREETYKEYARR